MSSACVMIMDSSASNFSPTANPNALESQPTTDVSFEPYALMTPTHRSPPGKVGDDTLNTPSVTSATSADHTFFPSGGDGFGAEMAENSPNLIGMRIYFFSILQSKNANSSLI